MCKSVYTPHYCHHRYGCAEEHCDVAQRSDGKACREHILRLDLVSDNSADYLTCTVNYGKSGYNYCEFGFDKFERGSSSNTLYEKKETFVHAELDRYYIQAKKIITENRAFFDKLVSTLMEKKTLTSKDIAKIKSSLNR